MKSQPLKWHGGKRYLAKRIVELMPPHLHYVEPYFGGGAVLFAHDPNRNWCEDAPDYDGSAAMRGCSEVVNDIDRELTEFWRVLQDKCLFHFFQQQVALTPFSQSEWDLAQASLGERPAERAARFFVRYRQSRQGLGTDFATLSRNRTRRGMNEQVASWLSAVEGLPEAHERLKQVVILNKEALDVIHQQDGSRTHFYCDPPYLQETRTAKNAYRHEMTPTQHEDLLLMLNGIQGTFQLSGYDNPMYTRMAKAFGWHRVDFKIDNKASSKKTKPQMVESLWMNYEPLRAR